MTSFPHPKAITSSSQDPLRPGSTINNISTVLAKQITVLLTHLLLVDAYVCLYININMCTYACH